MTESVITRRDHSFTTPPALPTYLSRQQVALFLSFILKVNGLVLLLCDLVDPYQSQAFDIVALKMIH